MHGLVLKTVQKFVTDLYGSARWGEIMLRTGLEFEEFEMMSAYDADIGGRLLDTTSKELNRDKLELLEDIGAYLVSHPSLESLRRLLRFGGANFTEFLHSLDDLPGRVQLAVPDLSLPPMELREHSANHFSLTCSCEFQGFGHVMVGLLRTMADDYGALVMVEMRVFANGCETLSITLVEDTFSEGRDFDLGAMVA